MKFVVSEDNLICLWISYLEICKYFRINIDYIL